MMSGDSFLRDWSNVIRESDRYVQCRRCRKKMEKDEVRWSYIPGKSGRLPFCDEDCERNFIHDEMEYHKDMLAEMEKTLSEL